MSSAESKVDEIRRTLESTIRSGRLLPGDRLGSERELAEHLKVSRSSLRQALALMEDAGIVRRVAGRAGGTYVGGAKVERDLSHIVSLPELLRAQGFDAGTRILSTSVGTADEDTANALALTPADLVYRVVRIRLADGSPISLEQAAFPVTRFPGLLDQQLGGSLYGLITSHYGVEPTTTTERIEVRMADEAEAALLEIDPHGPLISVTRITCDPEDRPFEYSNDLFRADRTRILVRTDEREQTVRRRAHSIELIPESR